MALKWCIVPMRRYTRRIRWEGVCRNRERFEKWWYDTIQSTIRRLKFKDLFGCFWLDSYYNGGRCIERSAIALLFFIKHWDFFSFCPLVVFVVAHLEFFLPCFFYFGGVLGAHKARKKSFQMLLLYCVLGARAAPKRRPSIVCRCLKWLFFNLSKSLYKDGSDAAAGRIPPPRAQSLVEKKACKNVASKFCFSHSPLECWGRRWKRGKKRRILPPRLWPPPRAAPDSHPDLT